MEYNELYHYGVKGMKWGVRRYQNKDGSYTKLGQKQNYKILKDIAKDRSNRLGGSVGKNELVTSAADRVYNTGKKSRESLNRLVRVHREFENEYRRRLDDLYTEKKGNPTRKEIRDLDEVVRNKYRKDLDKLQKESNKNQDEYYAEIRQVVDDLLGKYGNRSIKDYNGNKYQASTALMSQIVWGNNIRRDI